jgi:hypothetical protein
MSTHSASLPVGRSWDHSVNLPDMAPYGSAAAPPAPRAVRRSFCVSTFGSRSNSSSMASAAALRQTSTETPRLRASASNLRHQARSLSIGSSVTGAAHEVLAVYSTSARHPPTAFARNPRSSRTRNPLPCCPVVTRIVTYALQAPAQEEGPGGGDHSPLFRQADMSLDRSLTPLRSNATRRASFIGMPALSRAARWGRIHLSGRVPGGAGLWMPKRDEPGPDTTASGPPR